MAIKELPRIKVLCSGKDSVFKQRNETFLSPLDVSRVLFGRAQQYMFVLLLHVLFLYCLGTHRLRVYS